jgi:DNA polymerase
MDGEDTASGVEFDGVRVTACERCPELVDSRSRIVNGVGPEDAAVVFVGEGPGASEDERGEPFVGRSGSVLDEALAEAGLSRSRVRITNCVRCRPPENRDPRTDELANCRGFLESELKTVAPEVVVTLGKVPSQHLLDRSVAVTKEAGSVHDLRLDDVSLRLLISVHPAATLYDRSQRDGFFETIAEAARLAGVEGGEGGDGDGGGRSGQSSLGDF